jgi:DMSO/TMAO reductase YedYZ molybdopterin-dependent catalytic subunit
LSPRGTDWSLALLVAILVATGVLTWFSGDKGDAWVYAVHGAAGGALALLLIWKLGRAAARLRPARWDRRTAWGAAALTLVVATLASGWIWITAGRIDLAGYTLLAWHTVLGAVLGVAVATHLALRAKRPRVRDVAGRRQLLEAGAIGLGGLLARRLQRPLAGWLGLPGARRRFTGSYEAASFTGNAFPTTSWVADDPRPLPANTYRLRVEGLVARPLALSLPDLDARDEEVATLDCTGGFYSTQRWRGIRIGRLLDRAGALPAASHVGVVSHTGYRWSFELSEARPLLLATHVGGEQLSHEHGAPVRLVASGRRGFQWVKWVERLELRDEADYGAFPSTLWSSFTPEGRGSA